MLKKSILCLLLTITSLGVYAQEKWFMQKINGNVSVSFPIEPRKLSESNYGIKDKDDVAFIVSFVDLLRITGMTLPAFNTDVATAEFAVEFMEGLKPKLPKYTFSKTKMTNVKGYTAYQVSGTDQEGKTDIFMNIVFIDGTSYSLTCIVPSGKNTKNKDRFLNEIYINGR